MKQMKYKEMWQRKLEMERLHLNTLRTIVIQLQKGATKWMPNNILLDQADVKANFGLQFPGQVF